MTSSEVARCDLQYVFCYRSTNHVARGRLSEMQKIGCTISNERMNDTRSEHGTSRAPLPMVCRPLDRLVCLVPLAASCCVFLTKGCLTRDSEGKPRPSRPAPTVTWCWQLVRSQAVRSGQRLLALVAGAWLNAQDVESRHAACTRGKRRGGSRC